MARHPQVIKHASAMILSSLAIRLNEQESQNSGFGVERMLLHIIPWLRALATVALAGAYDIYDANNPVKQGWCTVEHFNHAFKISFMLWC